MTGYRTQTGGLINRKKTVSFRFNGRRVSGFEGDTIASALLASGQQMVGRSFKYHRPRGVMSAGVEEGGALFNLGDGAERVPNVKGTVAEIAPDINVTSQNVWPSLHYDIGAVNGLISPFITKTDIPNFYLNAGWCYGGFKAIPGSGWCFAHTIAHDSPHEINALLTLDRYRQGRMIDEAGNGAFPKKH